MFHRPPSSRFTLDRSAVSSATLSRRRLLHTMGLAAGGAMTWGLGSPTLSAARQTPGVEPAPGFPAPRFLDTNGIEMGVYVQGDGKPLVLCHGFPEMAYSWRKQIGPFSRAGYQVIVPDQRGYGLTERPDDIADYTLDKLCDDMAGLLDALEIDKAIFIGHDWGGGVVWMMPRFHPDRVAGVIGVNTPTSHPGHPQEPTEEPLIVRGPNYYTLTFQEPGHADALLAQDVRKTFEFIMRRGGIWDVDEFKKLPEDSPERQMDLLAMLAKGDYPGELLLTEAELDYFVKTYQVTGFTGGLNWYRAAARGGFGDRELTWDIDVPCLYVGAENDVILRPSSADGMAEFIPDFERYTVADCGHWTQQEKPEELNRVVLDWLGRKYA